MSIANALPLPVLPKVESITANAHFTGSLEDSLGRGVGYLRLSLTRACSMRCTYCRPETDNNPQGEQRLTPDELGRLVGHLAENHGLTKVRLTGGDPTSRPDLLKIIERIASIDGIDDLAMTTNGLTLERMAGRYQQAGLGRVNISLDTLCEKRFAEMTGIDGLDRVLRGIDEAIRSGLGPVKLNTVVVRGQNERDIHELAQYAIERGLVIRFIELMPMGPLAASWQRRYVPADEMRQILSRTVRFVGRLPQGHDAATLYRVEQKNGAAGTIGFITPMSCNFCADCNRIRLAADGSIYPCLMDHSAGTLIPALRPTFDGKLADRLLNQALTHKRPEHPDSGPAIMTRLGG